MTIVDPEKAGWAEGGGGGVAAETTVASATSSLPPPEAEATEQAMVSFSNPNGGDGGTGGDSDPTTATAVSDGPKTCKSRVCYDFKGSRKAVGFAYVRKFTITHEDLFWACLHGFCVLAYE